MLSQASADFQLVFVTAASVICNLFLVKKIIYCVSHCSSDTNTHDSMMPTNYTITKKQTYLLQKLMQQNNITARGLTHSRQHSHYTHVSVSL